MTEKTRLDLIKALKEAMDAPRVHIAGGNSKMGNMPHYSTLMGDPARKEYANGEELGVVGGTCGNCRNCSKVCYARNETRYPAVLIARTHNTLLARDNTLAMHEGILETIDREGLTRMRWNASGEVYSWEMWQAIVDIAVKRPAVEFYIYTKRYDILERWIAEARETWGQELTASEICPPNLHISVSIWHSNYDNPHGFAEFIYDDHTEPEVDSLPHCPAVDREGHKTGVTCDVCGRCLRAQFGDRTAVHAH